MNEPFVVRRADGNDNTEKEVRSHASAAKRLPCKYLYGLH